MRCFCSLILRVGQLGVKNWKHSVLGGREGLGRYTEGDLTSEGFSSFCRVRRCLSLHKGCICIRNNYWLYCTFFSAVNLCRSEWTDGTYNSQLWKISLGGTWRSSNPGLCPKAGSAMDLPFLTSFSILLLKTCSGDPSLSLCAGDTLMPSLNLLCSNSFFILTTVGNPQTISKEYFKALHQMQLFGKCEWVKVWSLSLLNLGPGALADGDFKIFISLKVTHFKPK